MALTKVIGSGIGTVTNQFTDTNLPAGTIVQIQNFSRYSGDGSTAYQSTTSTSLVATDIVVTITPKYSSSKMLIHMSIEGVYNNAVAANGSKIALYKSVGGGAFSGVSGLNSGQFTRHQGYFGDTTASLSGWSGSWVDSPSTTSEIVYKIYHARLHSSSGYSRFTANSDDSSRMQILEIKQ